MYFFGAEMSQAYAAYARSLNPSALCTAYTDGIAGCLCTEEQIREGGCEPVGSARYFALGGTFAPTADGVKGSICVGKDADLLLLDESLEVKKVLVRGMDMG